MQPVPTVLLSLACLAFSGEAASMKMRLESHTSAASSIRLLRIFQPGKVSTRAVVDSLEEVTKGLQAEDRAALSVARASKADCKNTERDLQLALSKGKHTIDMATDDYQKTSAEVRSLEASLAELKGQISTSNKELDNLQARLKKMRKDKGLLKKSASSALQQVETVLEKAHLEERSQRHKSLLTLKKQVSSLERLSESLSFLQTISDEGDGHVQDEGSPSLILRADKQEMVKASDATQRGFNEEEKRLLDLIEVERKKLQDLEDNMEDLQPAISNKLQQAMEINRTIDAATRGRDRDSDLLGIGKDKCSLIEENLGKQQKKRAQVTNDVSMASKLLEHMDTALFLTKEIQGLKKSTAPLRPLGVGSSHKGFKARQPRSRRWISLLQKDDLSDASLEEATMSSESEGPFDKVTDMISGLIASLKAQASEEVNKHQFCQDSLVKNRRDRVAKKLSIDSLGSTIRWSKMAIVRLDDDLNYCSAEIERLADFRKTQSKALTTETARVKKEVTEYDLADEVISKVVVILNQLCNLGGAAGSLVQQSNAQLRSSRKSRFSQCKAASDLLKSASSRVKSLNSMTEQYLGDYGRLSDRMENYAKSAQGDRESEQTAAKAAKAQRSSELATAEKDASDAEKELKLIDDAKKELEHSCSHVETREEKMAKRKEEIEALREALKVLEGEAVPA